MLCTISKIDEQSKYCMQSMYELKVEQLKINIIGMSRSVELERTLFKTTGWYILIF